jgi:hypothetical protein
MSDPLDARFNPEIAAAADHLPDRGQNIAWRRDRLASKHRNEIGEVQKRKNAASRRRRRFVFVKS